MRVIAGTARGKNLQALPGEDITRPTINRVKEAMFSSVQFLVPGARVLDLFAGSGQLGIEALSRGAKSCLFVDRSAEALAARDSVTQLSRPSPRAAMEADWPSNFQA